MNHLNFKMLVLVAVAAAASLGYFDAALAGMALMVGDVEPGSLKELNSAMKTAFDKLQGNIKESQDLAQKAMDQIKRGDEVHAKTADDLKKVGEETQKSQKEFKDSVNAIATRVTDVEQKLDKKMRALDDAVSSGKSSGDLFIESDEYKALMGRTKNGGSKNGWDSGSVDIARKTAILNVNPLSNQQPLVLQQRLPGIITPGLRRFTIRDLLPNLQTTSNLIEFASELLFTNNAGPQFDAASPGSTVTEGALKNESALSFQLANAPVVTLAHFIPASRQILSDAPALAGYINARLTYGLKLEEENELLNGIGTSGKLNGLINQSTAFIGGATNQQAIDTLLKAFTQVSLSFFEASGVVLHPIDWQNILLLKDTQGRYLFSNPHQVNEPSIWGKPVVPTQAIAQGTFHTGAYDLAAAIFDRETISIRTAEQHSDWFARNLVAILCEERLALVVFRSAAMITGSLLYAG